MAANIEYNTIIDYSSISGNILWSRVNWSNSEDDIPVLAIPYSGEKNGKITRIRHRWTISQEVRLNIAVLYI